MPGGTYGPPPGTRTSGVNLGAAHEWAAAPTIVDATIAPPSAMGRLYSLRCYAPPHGRGYVPFDLTLNGKDYTSSGLLYHFYADNLTATSPTGGPLGGGTFYTVYGTGFAAGAGYGRYLCRFNHSFEWDEDEVISRRGVVGGALAGGLGVATRRSADGRTTGVRVVSATYDAGCKACCARRRPWTRPARRSSRSRSTASSLPGESIPLTVYDTNVTALTTLQGDGRPAGVSTAAGDGTAFTIFEGDQPVNVSMPGLIRFTDLQCRFQYQFDAPAWGPGTSRCTAPPSPSTRAGATTGGMARRSCRGRTEPIT